MIPFGLFMLAVILQHECAYWLIMQPVFRWSMLNSGPLAIGAFLWVFATHKVDYFLKYGAPIMDKRIAKTKRRIGKNATRWALHRKQRFIGNTTWVYQSFLVMGFLAFLFIRFVVKTTIGFVLSSSLSLMGKLKCAFLLARCKFIIMFGVVKSVSQVLLEELHCFASMAMIAIRDIPITQGYIDLAIGAFWLIYAVAYFIGFILPPMLYRGLNTLYESLCIAVSRTIRITGTTISSIKCTIVTVCLFMIQCLLAIPSVIAFRLMRLTRNLILLLIVLPYIALKTTATALYTSVNSLARNISTWINQLIYDGRNNLAQMLSTTNNNVYYSPSPYLRELEQKKQELNNRIAVLCDEREFGAAENVMRSLANITEEIRALKNTEIPRTENPGTDESNKKPKWSFSMKDLIIILLSSLIILQAISNFNNTTSPVPRAEIYEKTTLPAPLFQFNAQEQSCTLDQIKWNVTQPADNVTFKSGPPKLGSFTRSAIEYTRDGQQVIVPWNVSNHYFFASALT